MGRKSIFICLGLYIGAVLAAGGPASPLSPFDWEMTQLTETSISHGQLGGYLKFAENTEFSVLADRKCRVFPGDSDWPSSDVWKQLNTTLNGALIKAVPASSACYKQTVFNDYDDSKCKILTDSWANGFNR